jgi:uncharacterized protein (DUF362 family)
VQKLPTMDRENEATLLSTLAPHVAVACGPKRYDSLPPFSPGADWPEYHRICSEQGGIPNEVYQTVRDSFRLLGLDAARYGSVEWNPLAQWVRPGDTVVLKPNFVREYRDSSPDDADCLITHGSIIRAVLDYAYLALQGKGRLIIADAPVNNADFDAIRRITHLDAIVEFYRTVVGFPVEVYDLRPEVAIKIDGVIIGHRTLSGDPAGYVKVNLGAYSAFEEINHLCHKLYGAEYDRGELVRHHSHGAHEYLLSKTVMQADCVITLPKFKTHQKAGLTVNMKNLVGINGNKNWLPHHREGTISQGGDQFAKDSWLQRTERAIVALFKQGFPLLGPLRGLVARPVKMFGKKVFGVTNTETVRSGNWYGNVTAWRMVIDLNRILHYADAEGRLHDRPIRRFFSVVDGIVAGEGNGPLDPRPKPVGLVLAGANPLAIDLACARLMDFDYQKISVLHRALAPHPLSLASFSYEDVVVHSNNAHLNKRLTSYEGQLFAFLPHFGWRGHVELTEEARETRAVA